MLWAYLADMSKFPNSQETANAAIQDRIHAALAAQGKDLVWLAGEIGVSAHRLLCDYTEGLSAVFLWDISEILGVSKESLAVGRA
jgi:hypothetical protein